MIALCALLIALLVDVYLEGHVAEGDRAEFTRGQVAAGHAAGGLVVFVVAYVLLRGLLAILGH